MKKYIVLKAANYEKFKDFATDIVGVLNRNFSNLSREQIEHIGLPEFGNQLTFPVQPFCGNKYIVARNGEVVKTEDYLLGSDGSVDPPEPGEEWEEGYWDRVNNINFGHSVVELDSDFLSKTMFLVAESGYSGSTIAVEITLDRFHKPQAAVCRLTTPEDYVGTYARHFLSWASDRSIEPINGKW